MGLVLSAKVGDRIYIGNSSEEYITLTQVSNGAAKINFTFPKSVNINRERVFDSKVKDGLIGLSNEDRGYCDELCA